MILGRTAVVAVAAVFAAAKAGAAADFGKEVRPVLEKHCFSCHGEKKQKAGLSFEGFNNVAEVRKQWGTWLSAAHRMRAREMPPEEKPPMPPAELDLVLNWLSRDVFPVDPRNPDPGRVTIRRLNRTEYNNTIRDLLGVDFKPAEDFPADDLGYGFDNIGDALSVSPLLMEKYISAAEQVLDRAIVTKAEVPVKRIAADQFRSRDPECRLDGNRFGLFRDGVAGVEGKIERAGEHLFRIRAYGEMAGPEPPKMVVRIDGQEVARFDVRATADGAAPYSFKAKLTEGPHRLGVAFVNNFRDPENPNPKLRDRNLFLRGVEIEGPVGGPPPGPTESYKKIFIATPDARRATNDCLRLVIGSFASRAFRRPLLQNELAALTGFAQRTLQEGGTFDESVKAALTAVLVSSSFLFRGELPVAADRSRPVQAIDEYALASRLSYFLWSTMPDDTLFALAGKGKLRANLDEQVRRMLKDPRSRELAENFAGQWLQIRNLDVMTPDRKLFPEFDEDLRTAMRRETELFFADVLWADRSVMDFVNSDYTFANERLAKFYGIAGVTGPEFRRVSVKGTPRGGVFTQAGVLTVTSNPTRTSPVKRGKWVLENLLNAPPPPPPANVPPFKETEGNPTASLRERMVEHRSDPMCASCHVQMDAIGFTFEHFDAIGKWRDQDGTFAIDDECEMNNGELFRGTDGLRASIAGKRSDQFLHCITEKMLTYALGRGLEYYDMPTVDRICANVTKADRRISALVLEIVKSPPFQTRRAN